MGGPADRRGGARRRRRGWADGPRLAGCDLGRDRQVRGLEAGLSSTTPRVLILPGLHTSGPEHWQSYWEREHPGFKRVEQRDWDTPERREWVETLHQAITAEPSPVVLVAHSLACCLVAHWAAAHSGPVQGALLVAPSDVEAAGFPEGTTGFAPMPMSPLPFPGIVVASTDDEYITVARAERFAAAWGSRLEVAGALGHLNSASGLGSWPAGFALLRELLLPPRSN